MLLGARVVKWEEQRGLWEVSEWEKEGLRDESRYGNSTSRFLLAWLQT